MPLSFSYIHQYSPRVAKDRTFSGYGSYTIEEATELVSKTKTTDSFYAIAKTTQNQGLSNELQVRFIVINGNLASWSSGRSNRDTNVTVSGRTYTIGEPYSSTIGATDGYNLYQLVTI